jgi:nucleotide-binding universal stress UspA family protein
MPGIVVGVDGSAHARAALDWAMREAAVRHAPLHVLTVNPAMHSPWSTRALTMPAQASAVQEARQAAEDAVTAAARELGEAQPESVTVTAFSGFPAQALIDASRGADLLVIGSRGAGGFEALLLGSISHQVVQHAACPVVVVPTGP